MLGSFSNLDFVSIWKAASILVTGCFGVLALLTEFKDKDTKRITLWGCVSLVGIVVSSGFGVLAQLKETSQQELSRKIQADQTLKLLTNTDRAVADIWRMMSALDEPVITVRLKSSCPKVHKLLCEAPEIGMLLGGQIAAKHRPKLDFFFQFCFLRSPSAEQSKNVDRSYDCDYEFDASFDERNGPNAFWVARRGGDIIFELHGLKTRVGKSSQKFLSLRDLPGSLLEISGFDVDWTPIRFGIRTKSHQEEFFDISGERLTGELSVHTFRSTLGSPQPYRKAER